MQQPWLVDTVKVAFEIQDTVRGKNNWEGDHTLPGETQTNVFFAPDRALMTDLRNDSTHVQLTDPVSLLVIYESVGKGFLTGTWMIERQLHH